MSLQISSVVIASLFMTALVVIQKLMTEIVNILWKVSLAWEALKVATTKDGRSMWEVAPGSGIS
jgi:hypothetical protein